MTLLLFRSEVLAIKKSQAAGAIILLRPVSMKMTAGFAIALTIALGLYLFMGEYVSKVRVTGQIVPTQGLIRVTTPQGGRIVAAHVHDGMRVEAGQLMFELSSERAGEGGGIDERITTSLGVRRALLAQESSLQVQHLQQRVRSLHERSALLQSEQRRIEDEIQIQFKRIAIAEKTLGRYRSLVQQGFLSELQLNQHESDYHEQLARHQTMERNKLASARELLEIAEEKQQAENQIKLSASQNGRALALIDQESAEHQGLRRMQIVAPVSGMVTTLSALPGQAVTGGQVLASVVPSESKLEAHLFAPSRAIGFVEPGQTVLLRVASFPYQKYGQVTGVVTRVEHSPVQEPAAGSTGSTTSADAIYRIAVQLSLQSITAHGKEHPFRTGMSLDADIRQDRRRLIEWVLSPLIAVAKSRVG